MLGFDDSSFLKEYDSFIPSVFRQNSNSNPPESTTNEHPEEPTVVDYIPDVEYNSEGEAFDIIYISSDESCYEDAEEEWTDPSNQEQEPVIETQTHNEDLIIISSDEEELPISSICSKRKRKSYSPPIVRRPKISRVNTRRRHNNVRQRHRKIKIDELLPDTQHFSGLLSCQMCRVKLLPPKSGRPLQEKCTKTGQMFCTGCTRLSNLAQSKQEFFDMIQFFLTGKLPNYDLPPTFSSTEILSKLAQRQTFMKTRCQRKRGDGSQVVTVEELINLCSAKKGQCAITGWTCFLHDNRRSRLPYWALSFDHIMPICHSYFRPEAWSIANIQIMCSGINTVKGNYSDEEVKRWYKRFLDSQVIELY